MRLTILLLSLMLIYSCSKDEKTAALALSEGLKIFVTPETHDGDFASDSTLSGMNSIEKADSFCNRSSRKPDNKTYKALLVDGINRDPVSLTDWVLQQNTKYFRNYDNILIDETNNLAIFNADFTDLKNSICDNSECDAGPDSFDVWTGINDAATFATVSDNCNLWSADAFPTTGETGNANAKDWTAFDGPTHSCGNRNGLYCVEQP